MLDPYSACGTVCDTGVTLRDTQNGPNALHPDPTALWNKDCSGFPCTLKCHTCMTTNVAQDEAYSEQTGLCLATAGNPRNGVARPAKVRNRHVSGHFTKATQLSLMRFRYMIKLSVLYMIEKTPYKSHSKWLSSLGCTAFPTQKPQNGRCDSFGINT